jgi:hypothetical protein
MANKMKIEKENYKENEENQIIVDMNSQHTI